MLLDYLSLCEKLSTGLSFKAAVMCFFFVVEAIKACFL